MKFWLVLLCLLAVPAGAAEVTVPEPLEPWVGWVLHDVDGVQCPVLESTRLCAWPGKLDLRLDETGGSFSLAVRVDESTRLAVPGSVEQWPEDLTTDGKTALMANRGEVPHVLLEAGDHTVRGRFTWSRLPESLAVPPSIALLDLNVRGRDVSFPRRQADGLLWLQGARSEESNEDRLAMEVHRRVDDGVPVIVTTRLRLRVSGRSREMDLGIPLTAGTEPVSLTSSLPSRLDQDGHLRVQLRPGEWTITLGARSTNAAPSITAPEATAPWPDEEIWVFQAASQVRSVKISGSPGVDPQRTSLDEDWASLPAWRIARGEGLEFTELRRGQAAPPPDQVTVNRSLWLRQDGSGYVVRDRLGGVLHEGGRLELQTPGILGQVAVDGTPRVINHLESNTADGVEVREGSLSAEATLSYPTRGELPAVGWDKEATSLSATVMLPPGWDILAASGVDNASGTWIDEWSLMDLFGLLLIVLITWKVVGLRWAAIALLGLTLAWHEPDAPKLWWLVLLIVSGLIGALPSGKVAKVAVAIRWTLLFGLALHLTAFSWGQIRTGLFPQLDNWSQGPYDGGLYDKYDNNRLDLGIVGGNFDESIQMAQEEPMPQRSMPKLDVSRGEGWSKGGEYGGKKMKKARSSQVDPQAIVQTGPGVPRWSWNQHSLNWNGPVGSGHTMKLWLVPPWAGLILAILRVLALLALGLRFADPRQATKPKGPPSAALGASIPAAAALFLMLIPAAQAEEPPLDNTPTPQLLTELQSRLSATPECAPRCIELASADVVAGESGLTLTLEVHAEAAAGLQLPGPDTAWVPGSVTIDGKPATALRRLDSGYLAVRLEPGIHEVVLSGPGRDVIPLRFPVVPRRMSWQGEGWTIDGYRPDAPPPQSVGLSRSRSLEAEDDEGSEDTQPLSPWLELRRELDIGVPWLVHNELVRIGPSSAVVQARVPLLEGESVTTPGISVAAGEAELTLQPGETSLAWESTLAESDTLTLTAPADRPWTERWSLDCSPVFSCSADGLAPTRHMAEGRWQPAWQPWPGESVTFTFSKPVPSEGATTTIDRVSTEMRPGRRVVEGTLSFDLRSSQGGEQHVDLPEGADLISFELAGRDQPVQREGDRLSYSIEPGESSIVVKWRQEHPAGVLERVPELGLGVDAANVEVSIEVPDNKWLLWAGGPVWGAVVTWWQYVVLIGLVAFLLGRYAPTQLRTHDWFLLGLGMTQVEVIAPIIVVVWLVALGLRRRHRLPNWWLHDLAQLALVGITALAFGMLYWAVYEGLLMQPDMQVEGAGSNSSTLRWYVDSATELPRPFVIWLPLLVWKAVMLLWALWLASRVFRWVVDGWSAFSEGGLWKMPPRKAKKEKAPKDPPPDEPTEEPKKAPTGWSPISEGS
jgi:hypothetical protein